LIEIKANSRIAHNVIKQKSTMIADYEPQYFLSGAHMANVSAMANSRHRIGMSTTTSDRLI